MKNEYLEKKLSHYHMSTKNLQQMYMISNPGVHVETPATNRPRHGTAFKHKNETSMYLTIQFELRSKHIPPRVHN